MQAAFLQTLFKVINQMPQRERIMLLATSLTCILIAGMQGFDMLGKKIKVVKQSIETKTTQISEINTQLTILKAEYSIDPNLPLKKEQTALQTELDTTEQALQSLMYSLVAPKTMLKVMRDLFSNQSSLQLLSLKNLPPQALTPGQTDNASPIEEDIKKINSDSQQNTTAPELFRHALVIRFEGDFFSVMNYLKAIEALPWRFYWKSIDYQVSQYPKAQVTLELQTFSREKGVLGV